MVPQSAALTLPLFSTLVQGRPQASPGASGGSVSEDILGSFSMRSPHSRQRGEEGPGQSPRKSLLPALGVTAGQKRTFFLGGALDWAP